MSRPELPDLSGLTLLVVDDNDDSLEMLGTFLRACGARIYQARDAKAALDHVDTHEHIDAMITDLSMPEMDGVELVRRVRQRRPFRPVPAIAITGMFEQYRDAPRAGFDAFLRKPVDLDDLCRAIRTVVRPR